METQYQEASYVNDLFISYSRKDVIFASALEKALKNYSPPKDLVISRRRLVAFRDENDFTGVEYNQSLRKHLENSNKMLVICSPNARSSEFVNEEIRLFAEMRGVENIIPVLLSGIPNNEASIHEHKNQKAFPRSLTDVMPMPLAANFLNLDPTKNKLNKGAFEGPWYTVLANIYGVSRSEVEQRERKRNARTRRIWTAIVTSIIIALTYALILTLIQRDTAVKAQAEAERQEKIATTQRLAAESNAVLTRYPQRAILLAVEAVKVGEDNNFRIASSGEALRNSLLSPSGYGLSGHAGPVRRATISSDNRWLVTASIDKTARLWDLTAADPTQTAVVLRGHEGPISAVVISSDSRWIVTASEDKTARLWDLTAADPSQVKVVLRGHKDMVYAAVISNDSRWLVTTSSDRTARLWDLTTSDPSQTAVVLRGHKHAVTEAFISNDNRWLVTGSYDQTARLWDLTAADPSQTSVVLRGHEGSVWAAAISSDSHWIVTASEDRTARLWDLTAAEPFMKAIVLHGHESEVFAAVISSDSRWLVTSSYDRTARLWELRLEELIKKAQRVSGRNFFRDEWDRYFHGELYRKTFSDLP